VGNAVTQVARAFSAKHAISTTTSHAKATEAKKLGFSEVVDLSAEGLAEGVRRLTDGYGADIIVDSIGGDILSDALGVLAPGGSLTTLGYAASREMTIDVTNLIWKGASIKSFLLFSQPVSAWAEAWTTITELLKSGQVKPIVAKTFPLEGAPRHSGTSSRVVRSDGYSSRYSPTSPRRLKLREASDFASRRALLYMGASSDMDVGQTSPLRAKSLASFTLVWPARRRPVA
jgi:hypothetical protein